MKNILLIGSELGKGGAERSISLLSHHLENHYNVTLCILSGTDRHRYYKTCQNIVYIDPPEAHGLLGKLAAWKYRITQLKKIKQENKIDVSISFLEGPDYANILSRTTERVILSIRGSKVHDKVISGMMGLFRKRILIPMLYRRADQIICVTDALCRELATHFRIRESRLKTIYNFYETDEIEKLSRENLTGEENRIFDVPVIITAGRLHVAKEHDKLLLVFNNVIKTKKARLLILGDGPLKERLKSQCQTLGLTCCDWAAGERSADSQVYLMGFQSNAFKFYSRSALFTLSSSWEGFPNVLAEALISKIPVLSTDCYTGPREILNVNHHSEQPVSEPVRTEVGSLMPLLSKPDDNILEIWAKEIIHWLKQPKPEDIAFQRLTDRFKLEQMINHWKEAIEH